MKTKLIFLCLACLAWSLSACAPARMSPTPAPSATEFSAEPAYTAAAMTLSVLASQAAIPSVTPTVAPSSTPTVRPSITPTTEPTLTLLPAMLTALSQPTPTLLPDTTFREGLILVCDNSRFLDDVTIQDGTALLPGEDFPKTWTIENTGTCTWKNGYKIVFVGGDALQADDHKLSTVVGPGGILTISIPMVAPSKVGKYSGSWQLQNPQGVNFGDQVSVNIVVSHDAPTPTHTPTP